MRDCELVRVSVGKGGKETLHCSKRYICMSSGRVVSRHSFVVSDLYPIK